jgi:hypothetical protein
MYRGAGYCGSSLCCASSVSPLLARLGPAQCRTLETGPPQSGEQKTQLFTALSKRNSSAPLARWGRRGSSSRGLTKLATPWPARVWGFRFVPVLTRIRSDTRAEPASACSPFPLATSSKDSSLLRARARAPGTQRLIACLFRRWACAANVGEQASLLMVLSFVLLIFVFGWLYKKVTKAEETDLEELWYKRLENIQKIVQHAVTFLHCIPLRCACNLWPLPMLLLRKCCRG